MNFPLKMVCNAGLELKGAMSLAQLDELHVVAAISSICMYCTRPTSERSYLFPSRFGFASCSSD